MYSSQQSNNIMKLDPIIAVNDVELSAKWYEQIFGFKKSHGGKNFAVLVNDNDEIIICLHKWGEHEHSTLKNKNITAGNGMLFYFKTNNMRAIRKMLSKQIV